MKGGLLRADVQPLTGTRRVPGDKSISHRAAIASVLGRGRSVFSGYSNAGDCQATIGVLERLAVTVERRNGAVTVTGQGPGGLRAPYGPLDCRRSATTMRLVAGLLAGAPFESILTGDEQLLARPMGRVAEPLERMGATVRMGGGERPPLTIRGGTLRGIRYRLPMASAQVKSAVLLAGLQAHGSTTVIEPVASRDHTERLLDAMGARVHVAVGSGGREVRIDGSELHPVEMQIPGDFSSAAALIAAACLVPGSDLTVEGVGLNPTRTGFLRVLERMGASVEAGPSTGWPEPGGDIRVRHAHLAGTRVGGEEVPSLIDELPLIGLLGALAEGVTEVRGAGELRVKESDRISGLVLGLRALGADAEEVTDGFVVRGPSLLRGATCDARNDHRLAMTFLVASLVSPDPVRVLGAESVVDSFPGFMEALHAR
jgi:3-phosphoshikimate 1-carboxyvinyltransferase